MTSDLPPRVVIVGGGFGGLYAAQRLRPAAVRVTVIDRRNHHLFQPLLYQVAMAGLSPGDIAYPIRSILRRQQNTRVLLGTAVAVDLAAERVRLGDGGDVPYDYLILAPGAAHSYFGHEEWEPNAPGLKSLEDALEIRRRVLVAFECAEREADERERRTLMTFAIVGAGPTGVELAGALADIARTVLTSDFRTIDPREATIVLMEAGPRVLPAFPEELSAKAERSLRRLGVDVVCGKPVTKVDAGGVNLGDERIEARTVLWAAGVAASPLAKTLGVPLDRAGRVLVEADLSIPGHPQAFVIGDLASLRDDKTGKPVPGLAPAAIQEGRHAADNIVRAVAGKPTKPFRYVDKGNLATIGKAAAVVDFGFVRLSGFVAWLLWIVVHIFFLIGFRNRVIVVFEWAWAYFTSQRGARLITGDLVRLPAPGSPLGRAPSGGYKRFVELSDLRGDERLALVALLKVAVVADGSVSDEEVEEIGDVVEAFGEGEYRELVDEVSRRFQSQDDLKTFLETIERPEARELIYGFFLEEAATEALRGRESELVAWLADAWKIEVEIDDGEAR